MKEVVVISKIVKRGGAETIPAAPSQGGGSSAIVDGLTQTFFDRLFVAVDDNGNELQANDITTPIAYILARYNFATTGGVTFYAKDKSVKIETIAESLPFDGSTIKYNTETGLIEVIEGGTGEGGVTDTIHWDKIIGKPDLTVYALKTDIPSLSDYALKSDLADYIKAYGESEITGLKTFTNGLRGNYWKIGEINGNPYLYMIGKSTGVLRLGTENAPMTIDEKGNVEIFGGATVDGNLLVKGGLTFYSTNGKATSFLIDVSNWEDINSTSVTQVYTAKAIKLLKDGIEAKLTTELSTVKTKLNNIKSALAGINNKSSLEDIGTALNTIYKNI